MHSTSIALVGGSKLVKCVHLITASGSFRSTVTRIYCWCTVNGRSFRTMVTTVFLSSTLKRTILLPYVPFVFALQISKAMTRTMFLIVACLF
ncbi:hypothetical protein MTR67_053488 [Solanum verrucosum]|uniref:Uncharacterized protein n=1 Tax=Solanum verrucosum TaxID=315347 RepID=A0AAF0VAW2_SOLVR|nr:hypothetical protein MTR67_053488 [Solanum verrucosum]